MARKKDEPPKMTRAECAQAVVKQWLEKRQPTTLEALAEAADMMFLAGNPNAYPNTELASWGVQQQLEVLENLNMVKLVTVVHVYPNGNGHQ
jgi:hypothetical protein